MRHDETNRGLAYKLDASYIIIRPKTFPPLPNCWRRFIYGLPFVSCLAISFHFCFIFRYYFWVGYLLFFCFSRARGSLHFKWVQTAMENHLLLTLLSGQQLPLWRNWHFLIKRSIYYESNCVGSSHPATN